MHYDGAGWLVRESRDREEDTRTLLSALHIKAGQTVCDFGCGNGFYTLRMAKRVGDREPSMPSTSSPKCSTCSTPGQKRSD